MNSRETDLLVKKVSEVEKQKPEGKRYQVSGEKKSVVADRLIANESRNSSSLSPTEESVRDTKENLSDVEEAPVLKRPKLDGEENQSNRSENAAFGGLAKFAEKQKEKVTDSDSVLKKPELSKSGGNEPADVIDKSVSEQENATFSSADNLEQSANLTDSEVLLPPKTNDNDHLAVRERVKNRSHVKKGSEERHSDRRHKVVGNNSTIAGKKQEKVKVDENEDYAGTGKKPRTEEAGPLEKKSEGLMTELNATKNVATEEKVTSLLDRVNTIYFIKTCFIHQ